MTASEATAPSMRLRRALAALAQLRAKVPPMEPGADTLTDDLRDALRELEDEGVALRSENARLRRAL